MDKINHLFGDFIKEKRHSKCLSLRMLSKETGISFAYLSEIERNIKAPPNDMLIEKIALVLNLDIEEQIVLYELAAEQKCNSHNYCLPIDISKYVINNPSIKQIIRQAIKDNIDESFWKK